MRFDMNNMIGAYSSQLQVSVTDLVEEHLPLVKRIATHFTVRLPPHIELDDLTQVGLIGLLKAIEDYKSDSGAVFTTYATIRIRGAILDELRSRDWLPRGVQKTWVRSLLQLRK
jgi:RNA polymerase sigma factor for flagellar operon FliA